MEKYFSPLSDKEDFLAKVVVDIAFKLHRFLGPGLLESVYEKCFCYELQLLDIPFSRQKTIPITYGNIVIENALKIDLLIDDVLILELKAQDNYHKVWDAQLLSYLKLTDIRIGYIINFHVPLLKDGFKRLIR